MCEPPLQHSFGFFPKYRAEQNLFGDSTCRRLWRMNRSSPDRWEKGTGQCRQGDRRSFTVKGLTVCNSLRSEQIPRNISGTWHEKPGAPRNEAGPDITRATPWISRNDKTTKPQTSLSSNRSLTYPAQQLWRAEGGGCPRTEHRFLRMLIFYLKQ